MMMAEAANTQASPIAMAKNHRVRGNGSKVEQL
jgi:hypothetical protein